MSLRNAIAINTFLLLSLTFGCNSEKTETVKQTSATEELTIIGITSKGFVIEGISKDIAQLTEYLDSRKLDSENVVCIQAAKDVKYSKVMTVMNLLAKKGLKNINIKVKK